MALNPSGLMVGRFPDEDSCTGGVGGVSLFRLTGSPVSAILSSIAKETWFP